MLGRPVEKPLCVMTQSTHPSAMATFSSVTEQTDESRRAHADAEQLRALAGDYAPAEFAPGYRNPEAKRTSRTRLLWLSQNYAFPSHYGARTWGYTILRTTYADDATFDTAVGVLARYMRAMADWECRGVADGLKDLRDRCKRLPEGVSTAADPRPSDEFYVRRFVNDVVQDREALQDASPAQASAFFRRWALERWDGDEWRFSAAGPRLKTAMLFDEETVAHLQGLAEYDFTVGENPGLEAWTTSREFWVKMVEGEPKQRDLGEGLLEWYRVSFWDLDWFWFGRDREEPATSGGWKLDQRFPGEWCYQWNYTQDSPTAVLY